MSTTGAANDQAFIKISVELRKLYMSTKTLDQIIRFHSRTNAYNRTYLQGIKMDAQVVDEVKPLVEAVRIFGDDGLMLKTLKDKLLGRITELEKLSDIYIRGDDIVAAKLSGDLP